MHNLPKILGLTNSRSSLIWVCSVCQDISVRKFRIITVDRSLGNRHTTICPAVVLDNETANFLRLGACTNSVLLSGRQSACLSKVHVQVLFSSTVITVCMKHCMVIVLDTLSSMHHHSVLLTYISCFIYCQYFSQV